MGKNLITGGLGFLGMYLARQLLQNGEKVVLFQRRGMLPPGGVDLKDRVRIISGDVGSWVDVVDAVKSNDIDCIFHLAALLTGACEASPSAGYRVNLGGTFNILEAARILGVHNVMFVSSGSTYGFAKPKKIVDSTLQCPTDMYGVTKVCGERLGEYYHKKYGVRFRGVRLAIVIGPGRQISYYYGDYSGAIERAAQGVAHTIHVDGSNPSALIYIKDAVRALVDLKKANEQKLRQQVYNVHGFTATMCQVAETVKKHLPQAKLDFSQDKSGEMKAANIAANFEMDNTAAREDFSWQPRYLLEETVEDFIAEVRAGRAE